MTPDLEQFLRIELKKSVPRKPRLRPCGHEYGPVEMNWCAECKYGPNPYH